MPILLPFFLPSWVGLDGIGGEDDDEGGGGGGKGESDGWPMPSLLFFFFPTDQPLSCPVLPVRSLPNSRSPGGEEETPTPWKHTDHIWKFGISGVSEMRGNQTVDEVFVAIFHMPYHSAFSSKRNSPLPCFGDYYDSM